MMIPEKIKTSIEKITGKRIIKTNSVSGGCINSASQIIFSDNSLMFLKYNLRESRDMFLKEANGLNELRKANSIDVPEVFHSSDEFILMQYINSASENKKFFEDFGRKFAALHKFTAQSFGFYEDNYIGSTKQINIPSDKERNNWAEFYFSKRIMFQFKLAEQNGYATEELRNGISMIENLMEKILESGENIPTLLHGDLWSGNFMSNENGSVCLIDPAVYYGNREADLAMTKLFGGFNSDFYSAYNETFPLPKGHNYRENIYKLYHVLNHLNLFGRGYYSQAINLLNFYK